MSNDFIDSLRKKVAELEVQLNALRSVLADEIRKAEDASSNQKHLDFTPISVRDRTTTRTVTNTSASLGSSLSEKFLAVLRKNQRFMKVREIVQEIISVEGGDEDELVDKLSRKTRRLKELNKIQKFQVGSSRANFFWGSPGWLNDDGSIKSGYEYEENALYERSGSSLQDFDL
ncbi:MAG: hypothetical protein RIB86_21340 [Imperialibacter sp.]